MLLTQSVEVFDTVVVLIYLGVVGYLGWLGYQRTRSASDYLIAGRQVHPFVMAMSYGATFISTSAIVGFGGVAGLFGMSLLWLTFLNIFVGIFIAFVFLGGPTRKMGHRLNAHTFPELLGRRYDSKFIQIFAGLVIFIFIPLYAAAVLIGGCEFIEAQFDIDYNTALFVFSTIIAIYVVMGGLKGVMYTDALQGSIMFIGMIVLLVWTYSKVGGVVEGHQQLAAITDQGFVGFKGLGFKGWTAMPEFGWGGKGYDLWWIVVSTITLGVGIGVLAQPQLAVRFMTVKSKKELHRAMLIGGIFIMVMTGVAFTVGSLSNLYFAKYEVVTGKLISTTEKAMVIAKKERGIEKPVPCKLLHIDTTKDGEPDTTIVANGLGGAAAIMPKAEIKELEGDMVEVKPNAVSFLRAVTKMGVDDEGNAIWAFNPDKIIPTYIKSAMPKWFGVLFLLTLLAAAMSTLSSQFHALGTSIGRDVYEQVTGKHDRTIGITRIGIVLGIVVAVILSASIRGDFIIARATAIFFGLCAATFLPAFVGGLFFKGMTRAGAKWSMIVGFLVTAFWLVFIKDKEARALNVCQSIFGTENESCYSLLLSDKNNWSVVDPIIIALPIAIVVAIVVSLATKKASAEHLTKCFGNK